jgi:chemotaxis protein methyltransferase CheR
MTPAIGQREIERFRDKIAEYLGIFFDNSKLGMLAEALSRRIEANEGDSERYLDRLAATFCSPKELRSLAQALTVTETYFFRNLEQFNAFAEIVLPQRLAARGTTEKLHILSAGCASGDEPYSLAITVRERCPAATDRVMIVAMDINPAMLQKARRARYSNWSLREVSEKTRNRWFRANDTDFALDDGICAAVTFEERNLVRDDPEFWQSGLYDVIFCRNVLMYFSPEQAKSVVARIARSLTPGGYLFLGHAETLHGLSNDFRLCHTHETFYYQLRQGPSEGEIVLAHRAENKITLPPVESTASWIEAVQHATERIDALALASLERAAMPVRTPSTDASHAPDLQHAREPMKRERLDEVLKQLDTLPAEHLRDPDALLLRATSLVHQGVLNEAEIFCRELLELDSLNAGAHYLLALCREGGGDFVGAVEEDQIALYLDPRFAMARLHLGLLTRRRGERTAARREFSQALTLLQQEDASRLLLFGGGFSRDALVALCRGELSKCGERT